MAIKRLRRNAGSVAVKIALFAAASICCVVVASPSLSADHGSPLPASNEVAISIEGDIRSLCELPDIADVDLGDLNSGARSVKVGFALSCNVPFELEVQSGGGLVHELNPQGQGGFAGTLDYALSIALPLRGPASSRVAQRTFTAGQMSGAGAVISTGDHISAGDGLITLAIASPPAPGLLAGKYSDVITMTLRAGI
ncbi:hypothetical protein PFY01_01135 [Brevundimonas vesicularis]|uniref:hypothetical protein n=1 Tax=Brevundimonas vesicularis TaxID=41276 RepID=UPI0022EC73F7|nr:hypothetical protein [Brevundimonas vesicularis]WBT06318.1 hypothetical protein PFY01_01135 [Brevundimonas vesicularis]